MTTAAVAAEETRRRHEEGPPPPAPELTIRIFRRFLLRARRNRKWGGFHGPYLFVRRRSSAMVVGSRSPRNGRGRRTDRPALLSLFTAPVALAGLPAPPSGRERGYLGSRLMAGPGAKISGVLRGEGPRAKIFGVLRDVSFSNDVLSGLLVYNIDNYDKE